MYYNIDIFNHVPAGTALSVGEIVSIEYETNLNPKVYY